MAAPTFALNHMVAPSLPFADLVKAGAAIGIHHFEIRNDLAGNAILDGTAPEAIRAEAATANAEIISINALQRFNEWTPEREAEARELAAYAAACGAKALVLVPLNDGSGQADGERQANLRTALKALTPILEQAGLIGLVEPLGFNICSLRSKKEAAEAITAVSGSGRFKLVHDTFHHVLAGEPELFPEITGLVHISGVDDAGVSIDDMRDPHRVMVTEHDRLDNVGQIRSLLAAGYSGPFSFEPFAEDAARDADPATSARESIDFILQKLG
ncbi:TIM barrel protein [Rhizobium sp. AAP43]|uniref:TIM barrel protein n=1 Tax=Rhizobium sp. AAP43 TaxID=1523420 RepID=UPI0006BA0A84|nr:TIM barrel protein [Rhizobium sp. AAP43]KPF46028.1 xylose isomerase [Rhizobium sp. AAP43]